MRPPSDEDLILYYYGESPEPAGVEEAIEHSSEIAQRYESIRRVLDAVPRGEVTQDSELYARRVWRRIEPRLGQAATEPQRAVAASPSRRRDTVRWAVAATILVALAFWVGRETVSPPTTDTALSPAARERILQLAVIDHLERSRFLLEEVANHHLEAATVRALAQDLAADNRLYRQAADQQAKVELAAFLDELERFLVELAHSEPSAGRGAPLDEPERQSELLFKVRVLIIALEEDSAAATSPPTTT